MITLITMHRGYDGETFVQVVEGELTPAEQAVWREAHGCLDHPYVEEGDDDEASYMFFRTFNHPLKAGTTSDLHNQHDEQNRLVENP